jgi:hypothetical protein
MFLDICPAGWSDARGERHELDSTVHRTKSPWQGCLNVSKHLPAWQWWDEGFFGPSVNLGAEVA